MTKIILSMLILCLCSCAITQKNGSNRKAASLESRDNLECLQRYKTDAYYLVAKYYGENGKVVYLDMLRVFDDKAFCKNAITADWLNPTQMFEIEGVAKIYPVTLVSESGEKYEAEEVVGDGGVARRLMLKH